MPTFLSVVDAAQGYRHGPTTPLWKTGTGTPQGTVAAPVGSLYSRLDGGTDTSVYRKEAGTDANGWVAVTNSGTGGGLVTSVDGRTGVVTLADKYVDVTGDTMTGALTVNANTYVDGFLTVGAGFDPNLRLQVRNTTAHTNSLTGLGGRISTIWTGSGALSNVYLRGLDAMAQATLAAGGTYTNGLDTAVVALFGISQMDGDGAYSTWANGVAGRVIRNGAGNLTHAVALNANYPAVGGGGSITNAYGLYVGPQKAAGVTNGYGVYQAGGNDVSYFGGRVSIGTTDFGYALHVNRASTIADSNPQAQRVYHSWTGTADSSGVYASALGATMSVSNNAGNTFTNAAGEAVAGLGGTGLVTGAGTFSTYVNGVIGSIAKYGTSTLSDGRAIYAAGPWIVGGTITTATGVDIGPQKIAGVTNGFGIYQRGASDLNYFAGQVQSVSFRQAAGPTWTSGIGSPEGVVAAPIGSLFSRIDGSAGTSIYRKEIGVGATGWAADVQIAASGYVPVDGSYAATGTSVMKSRVAGNAQPQFSINANGNLIWGDGVSAPDVNFYRTAVGQLQVNGNFVSTGTITANDWSSFRPTNLPTFVSSAASGAFIGGPPFSRSWHDVLRFNVTGVPVEETLVGSTWTPRALTTSLFDGTENAATGIIDGTTATAVRWTWNSTFATDMQWLRIAFGYVVPVPGIAIDVEQSNDGVVWTYVINNATYANANAETLWLRTAGVSNTNNSRITIRSTNARPININILQWYTHRTGDQGRGVFVEYPYSWNYAKQIGVGGAFPANGPLTVGTNTTTPAGGLWFGTDTTLYRSAVGRVRTPGTFVADGGIWQEAGAGVLAFGSRVTGDAQLRWYIAHDGTMRWGSGAVAPDVNLYWGGTGVLRTDASFAGFGNLLLGTTNAALVNTDTANQPLLDTNDRVLVVNGAATGAAVNIESSLPLDGTSIGKRVGSLVFSSTLGQLDAHRQLGGIVSRVTSIAGTYSLQTDLGFYVKANTAAQEVLTLSAALATLRPPLSLGTNPASYGMIRLPNGERINWRNAANTADVGQIVAQADDNLWVNAEATRQGYLSSGGAAKVGWNSTSFFFIDGVNLVTSTTTGTKWGTGTTQKQSWWNATPVVQNTGWAATAGYTALKSFNSTTCTLNELARVTATLIDALKSYGLLG